MLEERVGARKHIERLPAQEPFALRGCVLAPTDRIGGGCVVVGGGGVSEVGEGGPHGSMGTIRTGGAILPSPIGPHGHPDCGVFTPWEPPNLYENRYLRRESEAYKRVTKRPRNEPRWKATSLLCAPPSVTSRHAPWWVA